MKKQTARKMPAEKMIQHLAEELGIAPAGTWQLLTLLEDHEKRIRFFEGARYGQLIADLKTKLERLENRLQHFDALQSTIERLKSSHDDLAYRVDVPDPRERR